MKARIEISRLWPGVLHGGSSQSVIGRILPGGGPWGVVLILVSRLDEQHLVDDQFFHDGGACRSEIVERNSAIEPAP